MPLSPEQTAALQGGLDIYHSTGLCLALAARDTLDPAFALRERAGRFRTGKMTQVGRMFSLDMDIGMPILLERVGYAPDAGPLTAPDFQQTVERLSGRTALTGWDQLRAAAAQALSERVGCTLELRQKPGGPGLDVVFPTASDTAPSPRRRPHGVWI
jgi:hypothetical protein